MANRIKVSVPQMKDDQDTIHAVAETIPQFVQELDGSMRSLGTCWEGPAWETYQYKFLGGQYG